MISLNRIAPLTICLIILVGCIFDSALGFAPTRTNISGGRKSMIGKRSSLAGINRESTKLHMARPKKKRRKRKKSSQPESSSSASSMPAPIIPEDDLQAMKEMSNSGTKLSLEEIKAIANFQAQPGQAAEAGVPSAEGDALVELPDIRNVLKNKEMKQIEEEEAEKKQRPKISRKDTKAFLELLEAEPFADADPTYFEDEEYGTVSALLAEGAKPFLGVPPGPIQVGHFIGSLGIILCAFIEYPGFPLTNLPTPLRDALQGGLGVIYLINTVLAVGAVFKASERGQNPVLWAIKTFSVGGLALDQLTQLPTTAQVEELKNRKGARAIKNLRK